MAAHEPPRHGPRGPRGPKGNAGPAGPAGPPARFGAPVERNIESETPRRPNPIHATLVILTLWTSNAGQVDVWVDDVLVASVTGEGDSRVPVTFIVPAGSSYRTVTTGRGALLSAIEQEIG